MAPYVRTGGLADIAGTLPLALKKLGHRLFCILPLYFPSAIAEFGLKPLGELGGKISVRGFKPFTCYTTQSRMDIPVYFINYPRLFKRSMHVYEPKKDNKTFAYFNAAVLALVKKLDFRPDIIQCHDWHAGLIPFLLKRYPARYKSFRKTATVFTIHNLAYQAGGFTPPGIHWRDDGYRALPKLDDPRIYGVNFAKRGIIWADAISTVSEQYAEEILTRNFGEDLQRILRNRRSRLFGIVNGIDYTQYNPATDPGLYCTYDANTLDHKKLNKTKFQEITGLARSAHTPMLALTARLSEQKGFDLLFEIIDPLLRLDLQLVVLGEGEPRYRKLFEQLQKKNPKKVFTQFHFDPSRETQILAAADILLMPSRFEPCGIGQMKSLRYGCIPVVHSVGGLRDTIDDFNPALERGNGFTFTTYDARDLLIAITRALANYRHRSSWQHLVERAMRQSFSWDVPAMKYVKLYQRALKLHAINSKRPQRT